LSETTFNKLLGIDTRNQVININSSFQHNHKDGVYDYMKKYNIKE